MKVLFNIAHADDEILWMYPYFQDPNIEKHVLLCSTDFNNPGRQWCRNRKFVLQRICDEMGAKLTCLDYPSSFYTTPSRPGDLKNTVDDISQTLKTLENNFKPDYIFTHNPYGEYGHLDHKLLFNMTTQVCDSPIVITDIKIDSNWPLYKENSNAIDRIYYKDKIGEYKLNKELFEYCKRLYQEAGVWTWKLDISYACSLYKI
jgi:LmbE family N-acetylglucosaminyl deacetylase